MSSESTEFSLVQARHRLRTPSVLSLTPVTSPSTTPLNSPVSQKKQVSDGHSFQIAKITVVAHSRAEQVNRILPLIRLASDLDEAEVTKYNSVFTYDPAYKCNFDTTLHQRHTCSSMVHRCKPCGAYMFLEERLKRSPVRDPEFSLCCSNGKLDLQSLYMQTPIELADILENPLLATHFRENSRYYNGIFSFASTKLHVTTSSNGGSMTITGEIDRYYTENLLPADNKAPAFAQLYILGSLHLDMARKKMHHFNKLRDAVINSLTNMINRLNGFANYLRNTDIANNYKAVNYNINLLNVDYDKTYNLPTCDEIAGIMPDSGRSNGKRSIQFKESVLKNGVSIQSFRSIDQFAPEYDALMYPLLHPYGNAGASFNRTKITCTGKSRRMTTADYYRFRLFDRDRTSPYGFHIPQMGRLFEAYVIDNYSKVVENRLHFLSQNQRQVTRIKVSDARKRNYGNARVTLPSSFIGGPRYMVEQRRNSMEIIRKLGAPTFFITFTANPRWPEVTHSLRNNCRVTDRIDIVNRVFRIKLDHLISILTGTDGILGQALAYFGTIEFQKRGLPHAHIILVCRADTIMNITDIEKFICAELPDPDDHELFKTVVSTMLHDCTEKCISNGTCKFAYPKRFSEATTINNKRVTYKRPDNGRTFKKKHHGFTRTYTNQHVVPYSPVLSKIMDAHINVEYVTTSLAVKYVFKYVTKGNDNIRFSLSNERNEIKEYITGRYLSASECIWRLLENPIVFSNIQITPLPIHLPESNDIYIPENFDIEDGDLDNIISNQKDSPLTAYFTLCISDHVAQQYLYEEIPEHYRWETHLKIWIKRVHKKKTQLGTNFGRLYQFQPKHGDIYYLYVLLLTTRGVQGFDWLLKFNGISHDSFYDVARARGLLSSSTTFRLIIEDFLRNECHPRRVVQGFAEILYHHQITDPTKFFNEFREALLHECDILYPGSNDLDLDLLLRYEMTKAFENIDPEVLHSPSYFPFVSAEKVASLLKTSFRSLDPDYYGNYDPATLNDDQRSFYDFVLNDDNTESISNVYFLDGCGGSGKSTTIRTLLCGAHRKGLIVQALATTGIAASRFLHGMTVHRFFKLPLELNTIACLNLPRTHPVQNIDLLTIDEVSMLDRDNFELIDKSLRIFKGNNKPFGGIRTVLTGDFHQLLPVRTESSEAEISSACLLNSSLWPEVTQFKLSKNMRAKDMNDWNNFLSFVGKAPNGSQIVLPPECIIVSDLPGMIKAVYGDSIMDVHNAILCPTNTEVRLVNTTVMNMLTTDQQSFHSITEITSSTGTLQEAIAISNPGFPDHILDLKIGASIMVLRNINPQLTNGTRLQVTAFHERCITGTITTDCPYQGDSITVFPVKLFHTVGHLTFSREQLPITVSFGMTIHKSQCQTIEKVGLFFAIAPF